MKTLFICLITLFVFVLDSRAQARSTHKSLPKSILKTIVVLTPTPIDNDSISTISWKSASITKQNASNWEKDINRDNSSNGSFKWILHPNAPIVIHLDELPRSLIHYFVEPGDSICLKQTENEVVATGKGSDKINLINELNSLYHGINKPSNPVFYKTISRADADEWDEYLDGLVKVMMIKMESYKDRLTSFSYNYILADLLSYVEYRRIFKIRLLLSANNKHFKEAPLSQQEKCDVFDNMLNKSQAKWLRSYEGAIDQSYYQYEYVYEKIKRDLNYDLSEIDRIKKSGDIHLRFFLEGRKIYKGKAYEGFEQLLLTSKGVGSYHGIPQVEKILNEYYYRETDTSKIRYIKNFEQKARRRYLRIGREMPDLILRNATGDKVLSDILKDKIAFITFWQNRKQMLDHVSFVDIAKHSFHENPNIIYINIFTNEGDVVDTNPIPNEMNFYTANKGLFDPAPSIFNVQEYPSFYLVNQYRKILMNPWYFPISKPSDIISLVKSALALYADGPYLVEENGSQKAYYINSKHIDHVRVNKSNFLNAQTDKYQTSFSFSLIKNLQKQPACYDSVSKILALSDIEGNFGSFRKLLQTSEVIDENFNWIFGNGHLVFAGDMFDRGYQVTECLWLIYSLEEKAKAAGGRVHFILGNHEIMNLQGDHRYVVEKYSNNAELLGKTLTQLYDEKSELGQWLRTKNIVEKIGQLLFMHGGISPELSQSGLTIQEINQLARPHYGKAIKDFNNDKVNIIMSSKIGPFWFRGYYDKKNKVDEETINKILKQFGVKHIITGHTVIAPTVTTHYGGKVINIDTKHAENKSEALLVDGKNFYSINAEGKRVLLFRDEDK